MKKIKTEYILIGDSIVSMLMAARLSQLGHSFVFLNPKSEFISSDIRPYHGNGLWNQALNAKVQKSLPDYYDKIVDRLRDVFPISIENTGFDKTEIWSVLSRTPIHREGTVEYEKEYFRLEKRNNLSGQYHLLHSENIRVLSNQYKMSFDTIAMIDGVIQKQYGMIWDPTEFNFHLSQFCFQKFKSQIYMGIDFINKTGKRIEVETISDENIIFEAENKILVCMTGSMLDELSPIYATSDDVWIQGLKKKRKERHFLFFEKGQKIKKNVSYYGTNSKWFQLGNINYFIGESNCYATWTAMKGPDSIDRIIDEGLRLLSVNRNEARFVNAIREFYFEWEWKNPTWKETAHNTYWATAFEGDLAAALEVVWNMPV